MDRACNITKNAKIIKVCLKKSSYNIKSFRENKKLQVSEDGWLGNHSTKRRDIPSIQALSE
jgi:hypothetical protein